MPRLSWFMDWMTILSVPTSIFLFVHAYVAKDDLVYNKRVNKAWLGLVAFILLAVCTCSRL